MATARLYNLARMTTATTGTGTITLGSAVSGFLSFASAGVADGATVTYAIKDGNNSEIGRGVYTASGTTLTRATILNSTNSNNAINLTGSAEVFITPAAEDFLYGAGSASAPSIAQQSDSNTGLWFPAADTLAASTGGTERLRIDSSGNVGIGTSSPSAKLHIKPTTDANLEISGPATGVSRVMAINDARTAYTELRLLGTPITLHGNGVENVRITSNGNVGIGTGSPAGRLHINATNDLSALVVSDAGFNGANIRLNATGGDKYIRNVAGRLELINNAYNAILFTIDDSGVVGMNSGFGSAGAVYGCRAWVNFDGNTNTIRASGNVTSITDNGTGDYTINFTSAMPDTNYAANVTTCVESGGGSALFAAVDLNSAMATTSVRVQCSNDSGASVDRSYVAVTVHR